MTKAAYLLPSLLAVVMVVGIRSLALQRSSSPIVSNGPRQPLRHVYNSTIKCGNPDEAVNHCTWGLYRIASQGYPWFRHTAKGGYRNATHWKSRVGDALDSLAEVCKSLDRTQRCLQENAISDNCLLLHLSVGLEVLMVFRYICHFQPRDENLVHSLQCLRDKRVMSMLYFNMGQQCVDGMDILDNLMIRRKNVCYFSLNVWPKIPEMYCLPKQVISTCMREVVESQCGASTAALVQDYLSHAQYWTGKALESAGLPSNICNNVISDYTYALSNVSIGFPAALPNKQKSHFDKILSQSVPGTALDTVYGRTLLSVIRNFSGEDICDFIRTTPA